MPPPTVFWIVMLSAPARATAFSAPTPLATVKVAVSAVKTPPSMVPAAALAKPVTTMVSPPSVVARRLVMPPSTFRSMSTVASALPLTVMLPLVTSSRTR